MNKIYRVVWNASIGAWVAVSETAKSKTKSRSKTSGLVSAGIAGIVLSFSSQAFAEVGTGGGTGTGTAISSCTGNTGATKQATASGTNGVALGCNSNAAADSGILDRQNPFNNSTDANTNNIKWSSDNGYTGGSTAVGTGAEASGLATALGTYAKASNTAAVAIGVAAASTGNTSLAIGRQSTATADYAQAIGNVSAATGKGSLAVGHSATATGYRAIAIGSPDIENAGSSGSGQSGTNYQTTGQTKATAQDSIAFGGGAQATANNALSIGAFSQATAEKSVAIGTGAAATAANAVVIGEGANTNVAGGVALGLNAQVTGVNSAALGLNSVAEAQIGSAFLTNTAATTQGTVSFGNTTTKRRLTNLADGAVASDAVTVAQLQKQNDLSNQQGVDTAAALGGGSTYDAATGTVSAPSYTVDGTTVGSVGAAISNVDARTTANSSNITTLQNQTFKIKANNDTATAVGADDTISFADGNNISITRTGNTISVATSATPTFTTVTSTSAASIGGALTVSGGATVGGALTITGIANLNGGANLNGNRLTNVGDATAGTDAVNLNQLTTALAGAGNADALGQSTATHLGGGATYNQTLGTVNAPTYTLDDGSNAGKTADFSNVGAALGNLDGRVTTNTADIADLASGKTGLVQQANNTAGITVGAATGGTSVNFVGVDGNRQLTGIADGNIAIGSTDAVTGNQLNTTNINVSNAQVTANTALVQANKGFNVTAEGAGSTNVEPGSTVDFASADGNVVIANNKNNLTFDLAKNITLDSVTLGGTTLESTGLTISGGPGITVDGIDAGGKIIANIADGTKADDAVNLGQLNAVTATTNAKTDALGNSTAANLGGGAAYDKTTGAVSAPDYVLDNGNNDGSTSTYNNVGNALGNLDGRTTSNTADIANLASGKAGLVQQANNTAAITVGATTGGTTVNFAGTDGNRQLTGIADGTSVNDAATFGQLASTAASTAAALGTTANADGTLVTPAYNVAGGTSDNVKDALEALDTANQDLSAGAVQYERNLDGSVNYDRVTLNGTNGTVLGNVASGEISATSTEGVNGSQIHAANTSIASALGGNSTVNADGTLSAPTYTLDDGMNIGTTADFNNVGDALGNLDGRTSINTADIADLASNISNGAIGLVQQANNTAEITVGKDSLGTSISFANANGDARQLTDVANGIDATDAANMQQLTDLTTALGGNIDPNTGAIIAPEYNVNHYSIDPNTGMMVITPSVVNNVGDALNSIGGQINNLQTSDIGIKYFRTNSTQSDAVALGEDSIAIGPVSAAEQQGNRTISMGVDASSAANSAIAIGDGATIAQGADQSIAIGNGAQVNGEQSISIGTGNIVNGDRSGAIGDPSIINGSDSYSVGNNNTVNSNDTFALGNNITATVDGSVVLGSSSAATTGAGVAGYALQSAAAADQLAIAATTSTTGAVAVGDAASGVYRQITGVAAGTEDSDAVNVAQLKAVDNALASLTSGIGNGSIGLVQQVASGATITVGAATGGKTVNFAGNAGDRQLTGVAASGQNNAAATVGQIGALAGALGGGATVNADGTLTAPTYNIQGGTQGNVGDALGALDTALNDVRSANQSLNNAAVQYDKNTDGTVNKGQITLGGGANGTTLTNVKDGALTAGSKDAVNGGQLFETNQQVSNLASQISNGTVGLVQQAANNAQVTVAAGTGGTSVNMAGTAGNRTVTGVQSGAVTATSSDAINGSQLHASNTRVASALGGGAAVDASGNLTAPTYQVAGETASNVGDALTKLDNQNTALGNRLDQAFYRTNERIDKVEKRANAGIAAALSMESAPFVAGKFTYSLGAGFHGGENAIGATLRRTSDSGRWSLTGGVATASEGGASARIGISGIID